MPQQKEKRQENQKKITLPVPHTRFLLTGVQQTEERWQLSVSDPTTGEKKTASVVSPAVFQLLTALLFNRQLDLPAKQNSPAQTLKTLKKHFQNHGKQQPKHIKRFRLNRKSPKTQTRRP